MDRPTVQTTELYKYIVQLSDLCRWSVHALYFHEFIQNDCRIPQANFMYLSGPQIQPTIYSHSSVITAKMTLFKIIYCENESEYYYFLYQIV